MWRERFPVLVVQIDCPARGVFVFRLERQNSLKSAVDNSRNCDAVLMISAAVSVKERVDQLGLEETTEPHRVARLPPGVSLWRVVNILGHFGNVIVLDWVLKLTPAELGSVVPFEEETMWPRTRNRIEVHKRIPNRRRAISDHAILL